MAVPHATDDYATGTEAAGGTRHPPTLARRIVKDGFGWRARVEYLRRSRRKYDEFEVHKVRQTQHKTNPRRNGEGSFYAAFGGAYGAR